MNRDVLNGKVMRKIMKISEHGREERVRGPPGDKKELRFFWGAVRKRESFFKPNKERY